MPASILKRLPLRFNYDDSYFAHPHQAMPRDGYTTVVANILKAPNLELRLATRFEDLDETFAHVIYSGPIDRYFNHEYGRLGYRTLDFETFRGKGDYQGTAVLNYCDEDVPFTRVTEHKHFAPWEKHNFDGTICFREFSRFCGPADIPYYPIRQTDEEAMLKKYVARAQMTRGVSFVGRLGSYRYLDMDVTVAEAAGGFGRDACTDQGLCADSRLFRRSLTNRSVECRTKKRPVSGRPISELSEGCFSVGPLGNHDMCSDMDAVVKIDGVDVAHANAARRHVLADMLGLIGAVDAIHRILVALEQIERAGTERIIGTAGQAAGVSRRLQVRPALEHVGRRHPARPFGHLPTVASPVQPAASRPVATP